MILWVMMIFFFLDDKESRNFVVKFIRDEMGRIEDMSKYVLYFCMCMCL